MRNGSYASSTVSGSSPTETEIVESPTGPPPNLTQIVSSMRRSISSSPCGSISRSDSDSRATSSVMKLPALT